MYNRLNKINLSLVMELFKYPFPVLLENNITHKLTMQMGDQGINNKTKHRKR